MKIAREGGEISFFIHEEALVPALVEVAGSLVATIEGAGVGDVEVAHELGKVPQGRFDEQMKVVRHQHVAVQLDFVDRQGLGEKLEKSLSVRIVLKDVSLFISAAGDVVDGTGVLNPQGSGHTVLIAFPSLVVKDEDLTPMLALSYVSLIEGHFMSFWR
jgi:hypothetical protein